MWIGLDSAMPSPGGSTADPEYAHRMMARAGARWKRAINAQAPYRWNLQRLDLGRTLDLGCGIGRNLAHIGGYGVGVDHNATAVAVARRRGLTAYTNQEFVNSPDAQIASFDSILVAHVVEHMNFLDGVELLRSFVPYVRHGGRAVIIVPQRSGFRSDPTHVTYYGRRELHMLVTSLGMVIERTYSFPFPAVFGHVFRHNELVLVARRRI
jgi:SAM-dependent methyltransferase